jgi:hypothetical protein
MSRKSKISWRESDAEKLTKEVERFNAKIYRARYNHPELKDILPDTIKKEDKARMIEEAQTKPRSEFNKMINSLDRFTRRGAEQEIVSATGNRVTKWEKNEVSLKVAQINRERTRERKAVENMEATSRGKSLGMKRGEMGSERLNELKPKKFDFDKIRGGKEWEKFKASVEKMASPEARDAKMEAYKANYLKGLRDTFGEHASDIIDIIENLPADVVVKTYYREQEATIDFFYESQEMELKLEILDGIWQGVQEEYDNEVNG